MTDIEPSMNQKQIDTAIAGDNPILQALMKLEYLQQDLNVSGLFARITKDINDTWSLVIKLNALFEAAFIHLLTHAVGPSQALEKQFEEFTHARRIELAAALELLDASHLRFARTLNTIRNKFAHRVENVEMTLEAYIPTLSEPERAKMRDGLNALGPTLSKLAVDAPQTMMLVSSIVVLARIHDVKTYTVIRRDNDRHALEAFNSFVSKTIAAATGNQADEGRG